MDEELKLSEIIAPAFHEVHAHIRDENYSEFWLKGGRGCVHADTLLLTPKGNMRIADFTGGEVYCFDGKSIASMTTSSPVKYPKEDLYKVSLGSGKSIITTQNHKFLSRTGWKRLNELSCGSQLLLTSSCPPQSTLDTSLLGYQQGVQHYFYKVLGFLYCYWMDHHQYDESPLHESDTYLDILHKLSDEQQHNCRTLNPLDDQESVYNNDRQRFLHLLSNLTSQIEWVAKSCEGLGSRIFGTLSERLSGLYRQCQLSHVNNDLGELIQGFSKSVLYFYSDINQFGSLRIISDILESGVDDETYSETLNLNCNLNLPYKEDKIIAIDFHSNEEFYDIFVPFYNNYVTDGGIINHNSTKSTFASQQCILGLIGDPDANAIAIRKTANTLRGSILPTILFAVDKLGKGSKFDHIKSPTEITYLPTGQQIIMRGLDDPSKLKSIKIRKGYFKILWFEEVEEFSGMEEIRSVRQSVLRGGEKFITIFTFNPPRNPNHWIYTELGYKNPDRFIHHSHYNDVPRHWLGEEFFKIAERLKINNFEAYQHEYGGVPVGNPEEIIFSGCYEVKEFETPPENMMYQERFFFGADWGYANDPTTLIRMFIMGDCLYIDYEVYGYHTEIDDLPKLFEEVPQSKQWQIYADCAYPAIISYVGRHGYNIEGAKKFTSQRGSIIDGIEYLKSFKMIYLHPRCEKILQEFQNYSWKIDSVSKKVPSNARVDDTKGWDHGIDAIRYALVDYINKDVSIYDVI